MLWCIVTLLGVRWDPTQSRLAFCTGNRKVYMWSPSGALVVEIPMDSKYNVLIKVCVFTLNLLGWGQHLFNLSGV